MRTKSDSSMDRADRTCMLKEEQQGEDGRSDDRTARYPGGRTPCLLRAQSVVRRGKQELEIDFHPGQLGAQRWPLFPQKLRALALDEPVAHPVSDDQALTAQRLHQTLALQLAISLGCRQRVDTVELG